MSDVMLQGILRMPPGLWPGDSIDEHQRYGRYVQAADTIEQLTKERDCCLQHSEADDTEIEHLHAVADGLVKERDALRGHLNKIKPPVSAELRPSLCVGEYSIGKISENTIWIIKTDGEGGEFDADLFETFLNDFFSENF